MNDEQTMKDFFAELKQVGNPRYYQDVERSAKEDTRKEFEAIRQQLAGSDD